MFIFSRLKVIKSAAKKWCLNRPSTNSKSPISRKPFPFLTTRGMGRFSPPNWGKFCGEKSHKKSSEFFVTKYFSGNKFLISCRALGQNPTESEVKKYQQQYKSDQRINFDDFLPILHEISRMKESYSFEGFSEGLCSFLTISE